MSPPPTLTGLPLVGLAPRMLRDTLGVIAEAHRLGPVVRLDMGRLPAYHLVVPPEGVHEVLTYGVRRRFEEATVLLGRGLAISPTDDDWRRRRRLMQPMFSRKRIAELHPLIVAAAREHVEGAWTRAADMGAAIDAGPALRALTLDVILRTMLGARLPPDVSRFGADLGEVLEFVNRRALSLVKLPLGWPLPGHRRFHRANHSLRTFAAALLRERRGRPPEEGTDLIGLLLAARDEESGEGMDDGQIVDEILTIVLAGHETTATALVWTLWLLARHPVALTGVVAEVDAVLGGRPPEAADLAALAATRAALQESMRLYPPVWAVFREFEAPRQVCGVDLPACVPVIVCPWITHRLPHLWPDPERFDPGRFAPGVGEGRPRYAYFPFGGGPHQCIGNEFSIAEALVVLALVLQRFEVALEGSIPESPRVVFTLTPRAPVRLRLRRRPRTGSPAA